jgi:uncharacterized protein YjbJ (UPF0337 family)
MKARMRKMAMNRDQLEGGIKDVAGRAQQAAGAMADDAQMKAEGAAREAAGKVQHAYGDTVDAVRGFAERQPFGALALGVGIGVLIGSLLARRGND